MPIPFKSVIPSNSSSTSNYCKRRAASGLDCRICLNRILAMFAYFGLDRINNSHPVPPSDLNLLVNIVIDEMNEDNKKE